MTGAGSNDVKIYTKTGDKGETGLVGNTRIKKTSTRIQAIGEVDELNAAIGLARTESRGAGVDDDLARIQCSLFDLGAELASVPGAKTTFAIVDLNAAQNLETSIDDQTANLTPLKTF